MWQFIIHNTVGLERTKTSVQSGFTYIRKMHNLTVGSSDHTVGIKPLPCSITATRNTYKKCITNNTFNFLKGNASHQVFEITQIYKMGNYMKKAIDLEHLTYLMMTQQSKQH
jgi:hypothetical protein